MILPVHTQQRDYDIVLGRGELRNVFSYLPKDARVFLVTDSGVPDIWVNLLKNQFPGAWVHVIPQGELSKNIRVYEELLEDMLAHHVSRNDILIALGGGVVGDLAGFAAATYMRGIRFVNVPTTTLSQIDSSIGGKTAVDFGGVKNSVGAFWQPFKVIIDPEVLDTLPPRHYVNGLAEAVKAGMIRDEKLFEIFEKGDIHADIEEIIRRSLLVKKEVVEKDEREKGLRKILNFGHTYGHAYESFYGLGEYLHGECVAMGMMKMTRDPVSKGRLENVLKKLGLPVSCDADPEETARILLHDKKADHDTVTVVTVSEIGKCDIEEWTAEEAVRRCRV